MNLDRILSTSLASLNHLPVSREIVERYNYFRSQNESLENRGIWKQVLVELKVVWKSAAIPFIQNHLSVLNKLCLLYEKVRKHKKLVHPSRQQSKTMSSHIKKLSKELNTLFDISSNDCQKQLSRSFAPNRQNVWKFLVDQRTRRKKTIENMNYRNCEIIEGRHSAESQLLQSTLSTVSTPTIGRPKRQLIINRNVQENQTLNYSSTEEVDENDCSFEPPVPKRKSRSPLVTLQIPVSQISRLTTPVADRCGLSIRDHVLVTSSIVVNSGGSPEDFPLSIGSYHRHRLEAREDFSNQQFEEWQQNEKPDFPGLHFDSKMIELLTGEKQERLAVIISVALTGYMIVIWFVFIL
jgi:hypothetical protein